MRFFAKKLKFTEVQSLESIAGRGTCNGCLPPILLDRLCGKVGTTSWGNAGCVRCVFSAYFFFLLGCGYLVGCWQCQKSPAGKPCEIKFECGKTSDVTAAQDTLFHILQGICQYAYKLRKYDVLVPRVAEEYVPEAINATGTNVNFDLGRITEYIQRGLFIREMLIATYWV